MLGQKKREIWRRGKRKERNAKSEVSDGIEKINKALREYEGGITKKNKKAGIWKKERKVNMNEIRNRSERSRM